MPHYIVKTYDDQGRLVGRFEFAVPSDAEAKKAVADLGQTRHHELWCGNRWIETWPAGSARPAPPRRPPEFPARAG